MEKKKILNKLLLNKDVVSSLNDSDMNHLRGGVDEYTIDEPSVDICFSNTPGCTDGTDADSVCLCQSDLCLPKK